MFPPHKFSGCLYAWLLHVFVWDSKGGEVTAAGKTTNCRKSAGSSGETPMGVLRRHWVSGLAAKVQFSEHIGESLQPHTGKRENIPQSPLWARRRRGKLFIFCVATSKEAEARRMTAKPRRPVKFHREAGWRYRPGLGLSQLFHISEGGPSGAEGTGSANRFGAGPPIQRDVWRNRPIRGKNGSKINLGKGPYEFRELVWNETAPCGQHTHHWDSIRLAWGYVYVFGCCMNVCPILYVSILFCVCVCVSVCVCVCWSQ